MVRDRAEEGHEGEHIIDGPERQVQALRFGARQKWRDGGNGGERAQSGHQSEPDEGVLPTLDSLGCVRE